MASDSLKMESGTNHATDHRVARDSAGTTAGSLPLSAPGNEGRGKRQVRKPNFTVHQFPFYISAWRDSDTRMRLNAVGRAVFLELMFYCYKEGSAPTDPVVLCKIADVSPSEFDAVWPEVSKSFFIKAGRLHNRRVDKELPSMERRYEQKRSAGKRSAEQRRNARSTPVEHPLNASRTDAQRLKEQEEEQEVKKEREQEPRSAETAVERSPILATLAECEDLYARAGKPVAEKHRQPAIQLLMGIKTDKLPRLPNYIKWALASGTWSDPAHTKSLLNLIRDGDWDVELTHRTLPTVARDKSRGQTAQDEATRSFLAKRGAL